MFDTVIQICHLGSDATPTEMRCGVSLSDFAHGAREVKVSDQ
jgi:hypothetical protein